jgi:hypothetical protein
MSALLHDCCGVSIHASGGIPSPCLFECTPGPRAPLITSYTYSTPNRLTPGLQVMFSLFGFIFCVAMLGIGKDEGVYLPVLTGIIGVWTPSPLSQGNKNKAGADGTTPTAAVVIQTPHVSSQPVVNSAVPAASRPPIPTGAHLA